MIDELLCFVCELTDAQSEEVQILPLAGDASTRRYYRVRFARKTPYETAILMCLPELPPEGELPFINVRRHLAQLGVHVPQIYHFSKKHSCLLLEDFGDRLLQDDIQGKKESEILTLYHLALDEIFKIQSAGQGTQKECIAFGLAFDFKKLTWELNFFLQHTLCGLLGVSFSPAEEEAIENFFSTLCRFLAEQPRVLAHRDFHSRNLMVQDGAVKVIDFQDARLGPVVYDVVSLVKDAYVDLPRSVTEFLLSRFVAEQKAKQKKKFSPLLFEKALDWMVLQRSLKAAGTFGFMSRVCQNDRYLPYLPRVFQFAKEILKKYSDFKAANAILSPYLKMFQKRHPIPSQKMAEP